MQRHITLLALLAITGACQAQTTHELTNVGNTFTPAVINMIAGDSIHLVLTGPHTCTQVDQATWEANDNTSNGGFDFPTGEHTFVVNELGTIYYVCTFHAAMGMKGQFIVDDGAGVKEDHQAKLALFPNPAQTQVRISGLEPGQSVQVMDAALKLVLKTTPKPDGMFDVSSLKAGNYNVYVSDSRGRWSTTLPLLIVR